MTINKYIQLKVKQINEKINKFIFERDDTEQLTEYQKMKEQKNQNDEQTNYCIRANVK